MANTSLSRSLLTMALTVVQQCLFASPARSDFYLHRWEKQHESTGVFGLESQTSFYSTQLNFGPTGTINTPTGLSSYERLETDLLLRFGLLDFLSLYARASGAMLGINGSSFQGQALGFMDQSVGVNITPYSAAMFRLHLQFQTDFPGYSLNNINIKIPQVGDGSIDLTIGGFTNFVFWDTAADSLNLIFGSGYTYRTRGYSAAIPWSVSGLFKPKKEGITLEAFSFGTISLNTDITGSPLQQDSSKTNLSSNFTNFANGSYILGAINPSLLHLGGRIGYQFSKKSELCVSYSLPIWGQNAPAGELFQLAYRIKFGDARLRPSSAHSATQTNQFITYSLLAKVLRSNDRMNLVKINKGSQDGVRVGDVFDFFATEASAGTNDTLGPLIARGTVSHLRANEAALLVDEYYQEKWIEENFFAKKRVDSSVE